MYDIDGFMQERRYSIADTLELRLSCTNPSSILFLLTYYNTRLMLFCVRDSFNVRNSKTNVPLSGQIGND